LQIKKIFIFILIIFAIFEKLLSADPHGRNDHSPLVSSDFIKYRFNEILMPAINDFRFFSDTTLNLSFFNSINVSANKPEINSSVFIEGNNKNFSFFMEPIFTNSFYGKKNLGSSYSRNNISARFENAFIKFNNDILDILFGRSPIWWGQSAKNSIILNGFYPSFDNILFRYKKDKYFYELLIGQLNSNKDTQNFRIKRNISGHRIVLKPNNRFLFTFGEQIIYTGRNRSLELIY